MWLHLQFPSQLQPVRTDTTGPVCCQPLWGTLVCRKNMPWQDTEITTLTFRWG